MVRVTELVFTTWSPDILIHAHASLQPFALSRSP